jgi:hypothetical protein
LKRILFFLIVLTLYISYISCLYAQTTEKSVKKSCPNCNKTYITEDIYCPQDGKRLISLSATDKSEETQKAEDEIDSKTTQVIQELPLDSSHEKAKLILKKADMSRSPWPKFVMKAIINYERRGKMVKDIYRVYVKDYNKSLVGFLSPLKQKGNLLLMVDDNLWYYVKDTRKAVRITPLQRLSGGASYGDITRLSWSEDYEAVIIGKTIIEVNKTSYHTINLELTAHSRGATYHKINLFIEEETLYPRRADVYLQSGMKMKTLYFTRFEISHGKPMNREILFVDHMKNDDVTTLKFEEVEPKHVPDRYFLKTKMAVLSREVSK